MEQTEQPERESGIAPMGFPIANEEQALALLGYISLLDAQTGRDPNLVLAELEMQLLRVSGFLAVEEEPELEPEPAPQPAPAQRQPPRAPPRAPAPPRPQPPVPRQRQPTKDDFADEYGIPK